MSLDRTGVRRYQNGEPIDASVLNRHIDDLGDAVHNQMFNKTETQNLKWDAGAINSGILYRDRIAQGSRPTNQADFLPVLTGANSSSASWISFTSLLNKYANNIGSTSYSWQGNIYTSPSANNNGRSQGLNIVAATFSNAPQGMMVGFRTSYRNSWYNGNGTSTASRTGTFIGIKVFGNTWYAITLSAPTR